MAKEIEPLSLQDISPPSITGDENVKHLMTAIDPELQSVSHDIREAFIVSRINELPEEVLDLLAWQWHVDFYELAHSVEAKREMVLKSIMWHRKKGTEQAIIDALAMLGVEGKFTSWKDLLDEGAEPYTFVIDAKITGEFWERVDWTKPTQTIRQAIQQSKAARSWMSRLYIYQEADAQQDITVGTATGQVYSHDLALIQPTHSDSNLGITIGTATCQEHFHDVALDQPTHSDAAFDIVLGAIPVQGITHTVNLVQKTEASAQSALTIGTANHTEIQHSTGLPASSSRETSALICGSVLSCGISMNIKMTA